MTISNLQVHDLLSLRDDANDLVQQFQLTYRRNELLRLGLSLIRLNRILNQSKNDSFVEPPIL